MMTVINKLKTWAIVAGVFSLTILTLGGYARYQKRRAEKAERLGKEVEQMLEAIDKRRKRAHEVRRKNNEQRVKVNEAKSKRSYFDSLN